MTQEMTVILTAVLGFVLTFLCMKFLPLGGKLLGHDRGRLYAIGSEVNIGKPTGVGIYFVTVFVVLSFVFGYAGGGLLYMMVLVLFSMVFGFLDDRSKNPWGEYIKGLLDFIVAGIGAVVFTVFYGSNIILGLSGYEIHIPELLYMFLAMILIVVSINATNATDGVDGLSGTLTILSILTMIAVAYINGSLDIYRLSPGVIFISVLLAYLIFNFNPSKVLMGDAGSRAIGFFLAFYIMYLRIPYMYLLIGLPFLLDGGLSILKITIGRLTHKKIIIFPNLITPIHDHLKKKKGLSVKKTWAVIVCFALVVDLATVVLAWILH